MHVHLDFSSFTSWSKNIGEGGDANCETRQVFLPRDTKLSVLDFFFLSIFFYEIRVINTRQQ